MGTDILKIEQIEPWVVYMWRDGDVYFAAGQCDKDGVREIFGSGFEIVADPNKPINNEARIVARAKRQAVVPVLNALNVIWYYGSRIIKDGDVDWSLVKEEEHRAAYRAEKINSDIQRTHPFKRFTLRDISIEQARGLKLT